MQFVTLPFEYEELPAQRQAAIIPICIRRTDREGMPIAWGWFDAAARVQQRLRSLARYVLEDECQVSELAESALHSLWYKHGSNLGRSPGRRVYTQARWQAQDLKAGGRNTRRGVLVALDDVDQAVREKLMADPADYSQMYQRKLDLDAVIERLVNEGCEDASRILDLLLDGCTWQEVGDRLGKNADAARVQFRRSTARVLPDLRTPRQCTERRSHHSVQESEDAAIMSDIDGGDSGTEV
jgi:hypothetical protein